MKLVTVVAVALEDTDKRILVTQRPEGKSMAGMWEFPGGKIEPGETPEQAIARECEEELGIRLCKNCMAPLTFVSHAYADFHLLMLLYLCRRWEGMVQLKEHQAMRWCYPQQMISLAMPPADVPLVRFLRDYYVNEAV